MKIYQRLVSNYPYIPDSIIPSFYEGLASILNIAGSTIELPEHTDNEALQSDWEKICNDWPNMANSPQLEL